MGGAACPLHDAGNDRSIERGSDLQAARRGSLTTPAKPAGERESDAALTPRPGTRSEPPGTRSFAATIYDPDAQGGGWWHWTVFNIPATVHSLAAGAGNEGSRDLPSG